MGISAKKIQRSIIRYCFYVFWAILMIGKGLGYTSRDDVFVKLVLVSGVFAAFSLACHNWNKKTLIEFFICILLGLIIWGTTNDKDVILTFLVIFCVIDINLDKVFKITLIIRGGFVFSKFVLGIAGVVDKQMSFAYDSVVVRIRYAFGYGHPNSAHYELFITCVAIMMLYKEKLKWFHYVALLFWDVFFFTYTDSRTGLIMTAFLIVGSYILPHKNKMLSYILANWIKCYYIAIVFVSLLVCYLAAYHGYFLGYGTLSSRFTTAASAISSGLSVFGAAGIHTDFGFINILCGRGVVFLAVYIVLHVLLAERLQKGGNIQELFILLAYSIYTLSEALSSSVLMNVSLLYISLLFLSETKRCKLKKI